jgi:hypothetical protein
MEENKMSAGLMSDNSMFSFEEYPWHRLGTVSQEAMEAEAALALIDSPWYEKRPVTVNLDGIPVEFGDYAIVRSPIPSDPKERVVGTVKKNYQILQPDAIARAFDTNVNQYVETLGFLGTNGNKMFATWKLPSFNVGTKNDEIRLFGFIAAGYDGKFGASLNIVTVRVVCANTFSMAIGEVEGKKETRKDSRVGRVWSGRHNSLNLERDLSLWLAHVQDRAIEETNQASATFNFMAGVAIKGQKAVNAILNDIYPDPKPVSDNYPSRLLVEKQAKNAKIAADAARDRDRVSALFAGEGTEIDGSAWGLFNAVTEYENHGRMTKKPADYSLLLGNRAGTMQKAMNRILSYAEKAA